MSIFHTSTIEEITEGIGSNMHSALISCIESNNREVYPLLKRFIHEVLRLSIKQRSVDDYREYIHLLRTAYLKSKEISMRNPSVSVLNEEAARDTIVLLHSLITSTIKIEYQITESQTQREKLIEFCHFTFWGYSNLLYDLIHFTDIKYIEKTVERINATAEAFENERVFSFQIEMLKKRSSDNTDDNLIQDLTEKKAFADKFYAYKRRILMGSFSWTVHMYASHAMSAENANKILEIISFSIDDYDTLLTDILYFISLSGDEFGWSHWEVEREEKLLGKAYLLGTPSSWLLRGFLVDQIRNPRFNINLERTNKNKRSRLHELKYHLEGAFNEIERDFKRWLPILDTRSAEEARDRFHLLLKPINEVIDGDDLEQERIIAAQDLDPEKVNGFKIGLFERWEQNSKIRHIASELDCITISNQLTGFTKLDYLTFFEKGKRYFTQDSISEIMSFENLSDVMCQREDNITVSNIINHAEQKGVRGNLLDLLEDGFSAVSSVSTIILSHSVYNRQLFNDNRFVPFQGNRNILGHFREVPVYICHTPFLSDRVIIANFCEAFSFVSGVPDDWESPLHVVVRELSPSEIAQNMEEKRSLWATTENGITRSPEQIANYAKNSVMILLEEYFNFSITNTQAYFVGKLGEIDVGE